MKELTENYEHLAILNNIAPPLQFQTNNGWGAGIALLYIGPAIDHAGGYWH